MLVIHNLERIKHIVQHTMLAFHSIEYAALSRESESYERTRIRLSKNFPIKHPVSDYAEHAKHTKHTPQATPVSNEQTNVQLTCYCYNILLFITLNVLRISYGIASKLAS
jgi:hypothetical protein